MACVSGPKTPPRCWAPPPAQCANTCSSYRKKGPSYGGTGGYMSVMPTYCGNVPAVTGKPATVVITSSKALLCLQYTAPTSWAGCPWTRYRAQISSIFLCNNRISPLLFTECRGLICKFSFSKLSNPAIFRRIYQTPGTIQPGPPTMKIPVSAQFASF